jgi:hypothetical protein
MQIQIQSRVQIVSAHLTDSSVLRYVRVRAHASCLRRFLIRLTRHKLILGLFYPVRRFFAETASVSPFRNLIAPWYSSYQGYE